MEASTMENGHSAAKGNGWRNGDVAPANGHTTVPMPHINDLLAAPTDIDRRLPIKKLIEISEQSLRKAQSSRDFKRPAYALEEFVKASVLAVTDIPHHQDYGFLKENRPDLYIRHKSLLGVISNEHDSFDAIKKEIIADNLRTKVQPTNRHSAPVLSAPTDAAASVGANSTMTVPPPMNGIKDSSVPVRNKPPVHPKPRDLHGNAVKSSHGKSLSTNIAGLDFQARIENLRGPRSAIGQNSGINASGMNGTGARKPFGPRDMPNSSHPKLNLDIVTPSMPRAPEAIYSPARTAMPAESAKLPSSSSNMPLTRTSSSTTPAPGSLQRQQSINYFNLPMLPSNSRTSTSSPPPEKAPAPDTITANELFAAMKEPGEILLIDVRTRGDFNGGHIMAKSTICIEPSVLLRPGISAAAIEESLVLAPDSEQLAFDRRDQFDLVVFYDQNSDRVARQRRNSDDEVIYSLRRALVDFDYEKKLKSPPPRLLHGGLDAWVDLMGHNSLRVVQPQTGGPRPRRRGSTLVARRESKFTPVRWQPLDVQRWNEEIHHEEKEAASSPSLYHNTQDFLTRYPSLGSMGQKESMTSPLAREKWPAYGSSHQNDLRSELPTPPARPAPALSRPSHSGATAEHRHEALTPATSGASKQWTGRSPKDPEQGPVSLPHFNTGLRNPSAWCYANSVVQSLLASPGFGDELADTNCTNSYKVPKKIDDKVENPQLLLRIMSNLLHWMGSGKFSEMSADTLMKYSRHVVRQSQSSYNFGSSDQQDADEFFSFLLDQLEDETNVHRDAFRQPNDRDQPANTTEQTLLKSAKTYWDMQTKYTDSIIDKYWRGVELQTTTCQECKTNTYRFSPFVSLTLTLQQDSRPVSLHSVMEDNFGESDIAGFECTSCVQRTGHKSHRTSAVQVSSFLRLPSLLRLCFKCYGPSGNKLKKMVNWDLDHIDFSKLMLEPQRLRRCEPIDDARSEFTGSFYYQCYAIILHHGTTIRSGHYIAYVRDRRVRGDSNKAWLKCNDREVRPATVKGAHSELDQDRESGFTPYIALFQRKWL